MREWVRIGWHLGGMGYDRYRKLTAFERTILIDELNGLTKKGRDPDDPKAWK